MSQQFVWVCPSCARAVPNRLNVCRCGFTRAEARPASTSPLPPPPAPAIRAAAAPSLTPDPPIRRAAEPPPPPAPAIRRVEAEPPPPPIPALPRAEIQAPVADSRLGTRRTALIIGSAIVVIAAGWVMAAWLRASATSEAPPVQTEVVPRRPRPLNDKQDSESGGTRDRNVYRSASEPGNAESRRNLLAESAPSDVPKEDALVLLSTEELVSRSLPAVVTVEVRGGSGSGFYVSRDTVLTNWHVVRSANVVTLRSSSGYTKVASVLTSSPELDLAVLKTHIVDHDQVVLPLAEAKDVRIGSEVVAIGSPLGLRNTVTRGIVSGMRNSRGVNLIQTDAAINPGNSGGPLIDRYGQVIGVNTLKLVGETEAIGFAVGVQHTRTLLGPEFTAPSVMQRKRDVSLKTYEESVLMLAKRADTVEENWRKFKPECFPGEQQVQADREWVALAQGPLPLIKSLSRCKSWMQYFYDWAESTKSALSTYEEKALAAGVPAARLREVRQRYNMNF